MKNSNKTMTAERAEAMYAAITNAENVQYIIDTLKTASAPISAAIAENRTANADSVILYECNIKAGTVSAKTINLDLAHVTANFRRAFEHAYYIKLKSALIDADKEYSDAWATLVEKYNGEKKVPAPVKAKREAIIQRVECAKLAYTQALSEIGEVQVCDVVLDFYAASMGGTCSEETQKAYKTIASKLGEFENIDADTLNIKELRPLIADFLGKFWKESPNCEAFRYNCSATLARNTFDVFRVVYQGRKRDRFGNIERRFNYNLGLTELVLLVMQDLQGKKKAAEPANGEQKSA